MTTKKRAPKAPVDKVNAAERQIANAVTAAAKRYGPQEATIALGRGAGVIVGCSLRDPNPPVLSAFLVGLIEGVQHEHAKAKGRKS